MVIETIEVTMAADGTYTLQEVRETEGGRQILRTVTEAVSIPAGLSVLANRIYAEAQREFGIPKL